MSNWKKTVINIGEVKEKTEKLFNFEPTKELKIDKIQATCTCTNAVFKDNLLKDINNSAQILADLSYRLFDAGIMPYYLHVLDKVKGAHHFDLSSEEINLIYKDVLENLPGYLVPKLVREIAGEKNKTPLFGVSTF